MKKPDLEDYLQEGIYGSRETNPGERREFLGTLRERILLALTNGQVMQEEGFEELEKEMSRWPKATLLLNGEISYRFLSPLKDLADKHNIHHTTISNQETETEYGAVLTLDYAVEKEEIHYHPPVEQEEAPERKSFLKRWFGI
ncbi:DUF1694 domain-containing protein [Halobacillus litoralis]|uniref:DUF1694 domain-containing protein n=1 Tax=Halobacillus litoralis TaxID=45668 RepID=A0A845DVN0_9BACI|nr:MULTISPECIES: YueI family protein [Halobacillus]MYL21733.1 DUF1694 domain-containing protein [Halobacillus litoralis]MYL31697.1 DUF1694 domain-containing protein [Halobacillus halophilus]